MTDNMKSWHPFTNVRDAFYNVKNKIYIWFLNKFIAKEDEYYELTEPSFEWMILHNKTLWIQPCKEDDKEEMK